ncbi:MAG: hypothetical protein CM15mP14_4650 [Rhodospirillaceae bacterium]|nr:MAG: hypothetical protein CM15mP14_4650 [Rhodospirillaceae bacterium]
MLELLQAKEGVRGSSSCRHGHEVPVLIWLMEDHLKSLELNSFRNVQRRDLKVLLKLEEAESYKKFN